MVTTLVRGARGGMPGAKVRSATLHKKRKYYHCNNRRHSTKDCPNPAKKNTVQEAEMPEPWAAKAV